MENKQEINNLVNIAMYHVEHAIKAVNDAEELSIDSSYLTDLFSKVRSNLALSSFYIKVANDVTENISV